MPAQIESELTGPGQCLVDSRSGKVAVDLWRDSGAVGSSQIARLPSGAQCPAPSGAMVGAVVRLGLPTLLPGTTSPLPTACSPAHTSGEREPVPPKPCRPSSKNSFPMSCSASSPWLVSPPPRGTQRLRSSSPYSSLPSWALPSHSSRSSC